MADHFKGGTACASSSNTQSEKRGCREHNRERSYEILVIFSVAEMLKWPLLAVEIHVQFDVRTAEGLPGRPLTEFVSVGSCTEMCRHVDSLLAVGEERWRSLTMPVPRS